MPWFSQTIIMNVPFPRFQFLDHVPMGYDFNACPTTHCRWNRIVVLWDVCNDGIRNCCWYLPRYYCTLIMQVSAACNQQRNDCVILESDSLVTLWRRIQHPSDMGHILECWKQRPPVHVPERKSPAFRMHPRSTLASASNECGKCSYPGPPTTV